MNGNNVAELLAELVAAGEEPKCLSCRCYLDVLRQVREDIAARGLENIPEAKALEETIGRSVQVQSHDCLGCDPCLPVAPFNALNAILREPADDRGCSCSGTCVAQTSDVLTASPEDAPEWPLLPGSYRVLDLRASGAVCTLASVDLYEALAETAPPGVAIVGSMATENLGIERLVRNVVASPRISWLVLCGADSRGHRAGESVAALAEAGVDAEMRIVGAPGKRARLVNLSRGEVETFRRSVRVIPRIGLEDAGEISRLVEGLAKIPPAERAAANRAIPGEERAQTQPESPADPAGYFVIEVLGDRGVIRLEHHTTDHRLTATLVGDSARDLYLLAARRGMVSRLDHAAYLGYELSRAEMALALKRRYVQDRPAELPAD